MAANPSNQHEQPLEQAPAWLRRAGDGLRGKLLEMGSSPAAGARHVCCRPPTRAERWPAAAEPSRTP